MVNQFKNNAPDAPQSKAGGKTHTVRCGAVKIHLTVNTQGNGAVSDLRAKCTPQEWQGWVNVLLGTANIALRSNVPLARIIDAWMYHRFDPSGGPGQGTSIPDAIAKKLFLEGYTERTK